MKLTNAIKKLSKHGKVKQNGNLFWAEINRHVVEFMVNGRMDDDSKDITCIRCRGVNDNDDLMTDYWGGVWCDNLTQAIKVATAA